jgi:hypothetical protein
MWIFYKKHYSKEHFFVFNGFIFAGIYLRLGALLVINSFKATPKVSK